MQLLPEVPEKRTLPAVPAPPALPPPDKGGRAWILVVAGGLILLAGMVLFFGYLPRQRRQQAIVAQAEREANALPVANVARVALSPESVNLLLPGNVTPMTESYLYARASGYVVKRYADIGDRVRRNQVLADIEAPDLDAQVVQGQASLAQAEQQLTQAHAAEENARAQEELARVTWERYGVLVQHGAVSRQDADTQQASYRAWQANVRLQQAAIRTAEENVRANRANLDRLVALQSFEQVRAPFDGIITARNFDVGALVSASGTALGVSPSPLGGTQLSGAQGNAGANGTAAPGSSTPSSNSATAPGTGGGGSGGELYRIAQIDTLRVLVSVPQQNAATVRVGQTANVLLPEYSKRRFEGRVARTSKSLDAFARTMIAEVQVANHGQLLLPGMYAQVEFADFRSNPPLLVPGDSVMQTADGVEVAILLDPTPQQRRETEDDPVTRNEAGQVKRIHMQRVEVGRDYGPQIEITSGLSGWEYVVVSPGDRIEENALVLPKPAPQAAGEGNRARRGTSAQQPSGSSVPGRAAPGGSSSGPGKPGRGEAQ